jgi:hypothetical protein
VSISIDHNKARQILFAQSEAARAGQTTKTSKTWTERVLRLGQLCPRGKSSTVVAALATALLAKATDRRIDVYSLLDRGETENSYSARSLADNVWARHRGELEIDLGANGPNPLNNTPFIGKTRIDAITGVRNHEGWEFFMDCMEAVKQIPSTKAAAEALRGFISARRRIVLPILETQPDLGDALRQNELLELIDAFVAKNSEGGRRAQSIVAAILDACFGTPRIAVGVINDPDRRFPLDVSVRGEASQEPGFDLAIEVKDKPITEHHVRTSIEKTVRDHGTRNLAFVAICKRQSVTDFDDVVQWAAERGVKVTIFFDWTSLYLAFKCVATADGQIFEGKVFRQILRRAAELSVTRDALEELAKTANRPRKSRGR